MPSEKVCVLVVDDDTAGMYAKCRMLQRAGYEVEQATTGADCLRLIRAKRSQLVLLDVQLPDMNGLEICETLKADPELRWLPILQTSATFTDPADTAAGLNRGADAYLTEPLKEDVLIATVNALLRARRAEEELRKQREWLQVTLKSIGDGVIATDIHGRVIFMNPVAEMLSGHAAKDALARELGDVLNLVNEETREKIAIPVSQILKKEFPGGFTKGAILLSKSGLEYPLEDTVAPIKDDSGQTTGMVLVFREIGERKRKENQLQQLFTSEQNARKEAEGANRAKDEFLSIVSHELRTPLTSMLGWSKLLKSGTLNAEKSAHAIDVIERNVKSQTQIIEDLLDISRIIAGKLVLNSETIDLKEVIQHSIDSVRTAASASGISIQTHLQSVPFTGDQHRLQQVLWNLLTNAIKFSQSGDRIDVSLESNASGVTITVKDSGSGIHADFLPRVFERFAQDDASTTRKTGGLGIGLSIVQHLVRMHHGEVTASSDGLNKGSRFMVTFPVPKQSEMKHPEPEPNPVMKEETRLNGMRVLIVEDEPSTREMLSMLLSIAGAETITATNAEEAMTAVQARRPDVIISDIGLPSEDGYSFMRRLRAFEKNMGWSIPALALTAYARPENKWQALEAGFQMHASKPLDPPTLIKMVSNLGGLSRTDNAPNSRVNV